LHAYELKTDLVGVLSRPGIGDGERDEVRRVAVHGHEVVTYSFGEGEDVVLLINGGPGMPCDYICDSDSLLAITSPAPVRGLIDRIIT
jgi:hypothetical protein